MKPKNYMNLHSCVFGLFFNILLVTVIFARTGYFVGEYTTPKWIIGSCALGLLLSIMFLVALRSKGAFYFVSSRMVITSICCVTLFQIIWSWFLYDGTVLIGSFDSPVGYASCLTLAFPFIIYCPMSKIAKMTCVLFVLISIIFSQSRNGFLCIIVILLIVKLNRIHIVNKRIKYTIFITALLGLFLILLFFKRDSSNGRLFVIRQSINMIKDNPILGLGPSGFETNYMNYQAEFFRLHPNAPEMAWADNIIDPLNEYVYITVNYGVVGLSFLFVIIACIGYKVYKETEFKPNPFILSLGILFIFSLFSYPRIYPFTWFIIVIDLSYIFKKNISKLFSARIILYLGTLLGVVITFCGTMMFIHELKWKDAYNKLCFISSQKRVKVLQSIYPIKKNDSFFLYCYAESLLRAEEYEKCMLILREREKIINDYSQSMLWGDYYFKIHDYLKSQDYYLQSAYMCPAKFVPLYKLYLAYVNNYDWYKAMKIRRIICDKKVKIYSEEVDRIRKSMEYSVLPIDSIVKESVK